MTKGKRQDPQLPARPSRVEWVADGKPRAERKTGRPSSGQRQEAVRRKNPGGSLAYVILPAIVVILLGGGFLWFSGTGQSPSATSPTDPPPASEQASLLSDVSWPVYVARGNSAVKEAYQYAVLRPDVLDYMPCYCGCGDHAGHRSNRECFIADVNRGGRTIAFDQHGST